MLTSVGSHVFIDETKAKGYVVVAVSCPDHALQIARQTVGRLVLPGQRSIHMKHESPRRRSAIANAVAALGDVGVTAIVLDAGRGPDPEHARRDRALRAVVAEAAQLQAAHLVLDRDETMVSRDARTLTSAIRDLRARSVTYSHQSLSDQPLLSLPDVVAWCWARGVDWRRRVQPVVAEARTV